MNGAVVLFYYKYLERIARDTSTQILQIFAARSSFVYGGERNDISFSPVITGVISEENIFRFMPVTNGEKVRSLKQAP